MGSLSVNTAPPSDVLIDGVAAGQTPLADLKLAAGKHNIVFVDADHKIRETLAVVVKPGQKQNIARTYTKAAAPPPPVEPPTPPTPPADTAPKKDGTINPFAHKPS